jgi:hypothetical protein
MLGAMKHTPGPWRAGRSDMDSECGGCGMMFKNIYCDDVRGGFHKPTMQPLPLTIGKAVIERIGGSAIEELPITHAELHANAILMAAAPVLFDGNNEAIDFLSSYFGPVAHDEPGGWSDADAERVYHILCASRDAAIARAASPNTPA